MTYKPSKLGQTDLVLGLWSTDLYNVPDAVRAIYFLSDREDSQAYHLK